MFTPNDECIRQQEVALPDKYISLLHDPFEGYSLTPDRFKCKDCRKWKSNKEYSKNQTALFQAKAANYGPASRPNSISAGLRCRMCVGDVIMELQCTGPCGLYKSLDEFSKTQRRHPETAVSNPFPYKRIATGTKFNTVVHLLHPVEGGC
jgi:hypothetical protein